MNGPSTEDRLRKVEFAVTVLSVVCSVLAYMVIKGKSDTYVNITIPKRDER